MIHLPNIEKEQIQHKDLINSLTIKPEKPVQDFLNWLFLIYNMLVLSKL